MTITSINDLRIAFWGGTDAERATLLAAYNSGISAADLIAHLSDTTPHDDQFGGLYKLGQIIVPAGGVATLNFPAIPATYETLVLEVLGRAEIGGLNNVALTFNGDGGANYDRVVVEGNDSAVLAGSVAAATSIRVGTVPGPDNTAAKPGMLTIRVVGYAQTLYQKMVRISGTSAIDNTAAGIYIDDTAGLWRSTAAINRVTLTCGGGDWAEGTRANLYGVKAGA